MGYRRRRHPPTPRCPSPLGWIDPATGFSFAYGSGTSWDEVEDDFIASFDRSNCVFLGIQKHADGAFSVVYNGPTGILTVAPLTLTTSGLDLPFRPSFKTIRAVLSRKHT